MSLDLVPLEDLLEEVCRRCKAGIILLDPEGGDSKELLARWCGDDYMVLGLIEEMKNIFYEDCA